MNKDCNRFLLVILFVLVLTSCGNDKTNKVEVASDKTNKVEVASDKTNKVKVDKGKIDKVKNSVYHPMDDTLTLGDAYDTYKFFKNTSWKNTKSERGQDVVVFEGELDPSIWVGQTIDLVAHMTIIPESTAEANAIFVVQCINMKEFIIEEREKRPSFPLDRLQTVTFSSDDVKKIGLKYYQDFILTKGPVETPLGEVDFKIGSSKLVVTSTNPPLESFVEEFKGDLTSFEKNFLIPISTIYKNEKFAGPFDNRGASLKANNRKETIEGLPSVLSVVAFHARQHAYIKWMTENVWPEDTKKFKEEAYRASSREWLLNKEREMQDLADQVKTMGIELSSLNQIWQGHWSEFAQDAIPEVQHVVKTQLMDSYRLLALDYSEQGKLEDAVTEYKKLTQMTHKKETTADRGYLAIGHLGLAHLYTRQGKLEDAVTEYKKLIQEVHPKELRIFNAYGQHGLANLYSMQGKLEDAVTEYKKLIQMTHKEKEFDQLEALFGLGTVYKKQGKSEDAIAEFQKVIQIDPEHKYARFSQGRIYQIQGKLEDAVTEYKKTIQDSKYETTETGENNFNYSLACIYSLKNEKVKAIEYLQKASVSDKSCLEESKTDSDFDNIRQSPEFQQLINPQ